MLTYLVYLRLIFAHLVYFMQAQPSVLVLSAGLLSGVVLIGLLFVTTAILMWRA